VLKAIGYTLKKYEAPPNKKVRAQIEIIKEKLGGYNIMIQIGKRTTEDQLIATLLTLYAGQLNVDIVDLVINDVPNKENENNDPHVRRFDNLESFIKSLE